MSLNARNSIPAAVLALLILAGIALYFLTDMGERPTHGTGAQSRTAISDDGSSESPAEARGPSAKTPTRTNSTPNPSAIATQDDDPIVAVGTVTKPAGLDLAGLEVVLHNAAGEQLSNAEIEPDGKFELRYGRTLLAGWNVAATWVQMKTPASANPEVTRWAPAVASDMPYHPKGAPPKQCDLTISPSATIRGRVMSKATGQPIEGATVVAASSLAPWRDLPEETDTDADGNFSLELEDLPSQEIVVWAKGDEHQASLKGPLTLIAAEVRVISFDLGPAITAKGRVLEEASGKPVVGAEISICGRDFAVAQDRPIDVTGPDGTFELDCSETPLERATLKVRAQGFAMSDSTPPDFGSIADVRLGKSIVIQGKIISDGKEPLAPMEVLVASEGEWSWSDPSFYDSERVKADGTFSITLECSTATDAVLLIDAEPYAPLKLPIRGIQHKSSSETTRDVEIKLTTEGPMPRVVIRAPDSKPAAPVKIQMPIKR